MAVKFGDKFIESGPVLYYKPGGECYFCPSKAASFELCSASPGRHVVLTICKQCLQTLMGQQINWETGEIKRPT